MSLVTRLQTPFMRAHHWLYVHTDGRIGHRLLEVPTLLLRTVGRRSGQTRVSGLTYAMDGDAWLVVPSNGGDDRAPGWLHNVRAQPAVEVQVQRRRAAAVAEVVERGDPEHPRLWSLVNGVNHGRYERYQGKTERPIPVVRLTPRSSPGPPST
ncbi:MAG TPA: nitroreductase family deazaflavin-dependent oxidoreductase [Acidimicrobiales bacterium]|nr:nitroreductase family deazaflavin-dependent oxidoreductase [Acidimicrobiales bacterium]